MRYVLVGVIAAFAAPAGAEPNSIAQARQLYRAHDYDGALRAAYNACDTGESQGCVLAADYFDAQGVTSRYGVTSAELRARGVAALERDCAVRDASTPVACANLARAIAKQDPARALQLLEAACVSGEFTACVTQAGMTADATAASALLAKACDGGELSGCVELGARAPAKAPTLWDRACKGGNADGCRALGDVDERTGKLDAAQKAFEAGCSLDPGAACGRAAKLASRRTPPHARELAQAGCDEDDAASCAQLGTLIATGRGGARDWGGGLDLVDKSCKLQQLAADACPAKAMREHPPDAACASEAACKALCDERIAEGCRHLAERLDFADTFTGTVAGATLVYESACSLGDDISCCVAGSKRAPGDAYELACADKDPLACLIADARKYNAVRADLDDAAAAGAGSADAIDAAALKALAHAREKELAQLAAGMARRCAANEPVACTWRALFDPAFPRAEQALESACTKGATAACGAIAMLVKRGTLPAADLDRARAFVTARCKADDPAACAALN